MIRRVLQPLILPPSTTTMQMQPPEQWEDSRKGRSYTEELVLWWMSWGIFSTASDSFHRRRTRQWSCRRGTTIRRTVMMMMMPTGTGNGIEARLRRLDIDEETVEFIIYIVVYFHQIFHNSLGNHPNKYLSQVFNVTFFKLMIGYHPIWKVECKCGKFDCVLWGDRDTL